MKSKAAISRNLGSIRDGRCQDCSEREGDLLALLVFEREEALGNVFERLTNEGF